VDDSLKTCTQCKLSKSRSLFSKDRGRRDGLQCTCKSCESSNRKKLREKNKARGGVNAPDRKHCPSSVIGPLRMVDLGFVESVSPVEGRSGVPITAPEIT
jgi:hypothetical protein